MLNKKVAWRVRLQIFACTNTHARVFSSHVRTLKCPHADYFSTETEIRGSVTVDGDLSLWHQTSCCFILRRWTCEPCARAHFHCLRRVVVIGWLQFSLHISEQGNGVNTTSTEEDAESLVWNNTIAPRLQQLARVAAGSVGNAIRNPIKKKCKHVTCISFDQVHSFDPKNTKFLSPTSLTVSLFNIIIFLLGWRKSLRLI